MRQQGSIVRWDGARGFGFIRSARAQADVFFHVRDFRGAPEPVLRMAVECEEIHVGGKGPRAMAVRPRGAGPAPAAGHNLPQRSTSAQACQSPGSSPARQRGSHNSGTASPASNARPASAGQRAAPRDRAARAVPALAPAAQGKALLLVLLAGWLVLLGWGLQSGRLALWGAGVLLALNLLTVWSCAADKNAARAGTWRVRESQLYLMALLGGWPAAWLAQQNLRHKTRKASFRAVYWLAAVVHCAALGAWLWRGPAILLF